MPEEKPDEERRDGEGFLAAWSRRKRAVARAETQAAEPEDRTAEPETAAETDGDPFPAAEREITPEELAALPPIDEVTGETDLRPFQKRGVPEALRKAAMRKVWLSNTLICDHDDPAVDYAWDWNAPETVPGAGGVLQQDKVARMMGDLINRERPEPGQDDLNEDVSDAASKVEDVAALDATTEDGQAGAASQSAPALPTDPVRRDGLPTPQEARGQGASDTEREQLHPARQSPDSAPVDSAPVPPRRHGSAIPE